jgi:peptidoglycan/xylan/chitin deacetylase (PgdA/CDA1 family)
LLQRRRFITGLGAMTAMVVAAPASARGARWPRGKRAAVSLTYDDGLDSQLETVAPQLDEFGLKATFFLTEENMEARLADWQALARRGHEIADHTMTHPCELGGYTARRYAREQLAPMERFLDAKFGGRRPRSFAYPCGDMHLGKGTEAARLAAYRAALDHTFLAARTVEGDPNDPRQVARERYRLNAFEPTYDADDPRPAFAYVQKAVERGHWAILVFHDVLEKRVGEGDTSKAVHHQILQWLVRQPVWCAPMRQVFTALA